MALELGRVWCGHCGLFLKCEVDYDPETRVATVAMDPHEDDCNPALMRFFNEESQHIPPFGR